MAPRRGARRSRRATSTCCLLFIVDDHASPNEAALKAHEAFWPVPRALDLVPMRQSHFEAGALVLARVVAREGIVVFSTPAAVPGRYQGDMDEPTIPEAQALARAAGVLRGYARTKLGLCLLYTSPSPRDS